MAANGELDDCPGVEAETSFEVRLYIYDLSKELSKSFKKILKGKPLPGIWHTGLVAYGREYYFSSSGIESCRPGETILGEPDQILTLGKTELPYSVFLEYIFALGESGYRPGTYNLLEHNCNAFSQEVSNFLTGGPIPEELRSLPDEILQSKNLSNTLKVYFDKLNFKVEGSKGISFGSLTNHQGRRPSYDLQQADRANGDPLPNGHPPAVIEGYSNGNPPPPKKSQNSKSHKTNNMVNGESSVDRGPQQSQQPPTKEPAASVNSTPEAANAQAASASSSENPAEQAQAQEAPPQQAQDGGPQAQGGTPAPAEAGPKADPKPANGEAQAETAAPPPARSENPPAEAPAGETAPGVRRESAEDDAIPVFTSRRSRKYQDPPVLFTNVDGIASHKIVYDLVKDVVSGEEKQALNELLEYLTTEGGAWALGQLHLDTIARLLNDRNLPADVPVLTLRVLQAAALKEDVILLLHQDRKDHHIMSYLYRIENLPVEEQEEIAILMCNLCSNTSSFDWLMYISEWEEEGRSCNNSKVTVRIAVHGLLCDQPSIQDKGSALMYNLALKELFDDTATELAMAVIQYLQGDLSEEFAFRCLTAVLRFLYISYNDVPALMKMLGPDVRKFNGKSERVDELVEQIQFKLSVSA